MSPRFMSSTAARQIEFLDEAATATWTDAKYKLSHLPQRLPKLARMTSLPVVRGRDGEDQGSERLGADWSGLRSGSEQKILKVAPLR
jgi:hypothetical protein